MHNFVASSSTGLHKYMNGKSQQMLSTAKTVPVLELPALQSASRVLQDQINKDAQAIPDLGDMLTIRMSASALVCCVRISAEKHSGRAVISFVQRLSRRLSRSISEEEIGWYTGRTLPILQQYVF